MPITASAAAAAYGSTARAGLQGTARPAAPKPAEDFAAALEQAASAVKETGARSDALSAAHVAGKADMVDVVTAVAETELTVRTLVAVRDRVISAYQEIMRMPI